MLNYSKSHTVRGLQNKEDKKKKKKKKKKTAQERQVEMAIEKETTQWVQAFLILLGFTGRSFWKSKDSFGY